MTGTIARLSIKGRVPGEVGLPKHAVPTLAISPGGAAGDFNRYRMEELRGDPDQALLVVTEDLLAQLRAAGWPVAAGDLGENLTLRGIAEAALGPGTRLEVDGTSIEITGPCDPCRELYTLPYVGPERGPAFLRATAGRRGWYAKVHLGGELRTGAAVRVQGP